MDEQKYIEDLKANGVDLPELNDNSDPDNAKDTETKPDPGQKDPETDPETTDPEDEDDKDPDSEESKPKEEVKKRSIYHDYKDTKRELKSEREKREQTEKENAILQQKLDQALASKDEETRIDNEEDAIKYAEEIGADPEMVKKIIKDARKGIPDLSTLPSKEDIEAVRKWREESQKLQEQQAFEKEFSNNLSTIKELLPNHTDAELQAIKEKINELAHTKEFHDKPIDYIVWKNKSTLSALITPRKRGMESREKKDVQETTEEIFDFETVDYASLTPAQRQKYDEQYANATKSPSGLLQGADGKKILI